MESTSPRAQKITGIILTYNEERHIARAIESLRQVAAHILVVDSHSSDDTTAIAQSLGAEVRSHAWVNYATQFNWALTQVAPDADWVIRFDADEVFDAKLSSNLRAAIENAAEDLAAISFGRRIIFQGRPVRFGGVFPISVVRAFRHGMGRCENRWMDEHIIVDGPTRHIQGELLDDNLNSLSWWTEKHNWYASREAIDVLNRKYDIFPTETISANSSTRQAGAKRVIKERIYPMVPASFRALAYFIYRFILRGGVFDRAPARSFHVLQGFWYRYLVEAKVSEINRLISRQQTPPEEAILLATGIDVRAKK
jgi:glycosyltransferase involved in cell wall biosynthesis